MLPNLYTISRAREKFKILKISNCHERSVRQKNIRTLGAMSSQIRGKFLNKKRDKLEKKIKKKISNRKFH